MSTGIIFSKKLKNYDFGPGHPFRGDRFEKFIKYFLSFSKEKEKFNMIYNDELAEEEDLVLFHDRSYIKAISDASLGNPSNNFREFISNDNTNPITGMFPLNIEKTARIIVKNSIIAAEKVQKGEYKKIISIGGGLHHAKPRYGEGFCVYNDVVISARHLLKKYNLKRILILDTDAHAGNGTCEAFYSDPRVLFIDLHQRNIYPGTGYENEIGITKGEGFTVNIPLQKFSNEDTYRLVFNEIIKPLANEFQPQLIIRNGGSDPHYSDRLTQLGVTMNGFKYIGKATRKLAEMCNGREIDLICSGYNLETLHKCWTSLIFGLVDIKQEIEENNKYAVDFFHSKKNICETEKTILKIKTYLSPFWNCMK
jgi:acetoin utilization protein AcuC